jgi:peroxiredoxin Q/BCP
VILGVSLDGPVSHRKFTQKHDLSFPLLSDEDAKVASAYGVYKEKKLYGRTFWGIVRTTFVIGPNGRILAIYPKVKVDGHVEEVLASL